LNPPSGRIIYIIHQEERDMDFVRKMQAKDWTIAVIAFLAGAIIF
jgi:hypothetical protein